MAEVSIDIFQVSCFNKILRKEKQDIVQGCTTRADLRILCQLLALIT